MPDLDEKLTQFTEAITSDAATDSLAILEELRREREESLSTAQDELLAESYQYMRSEITRIRTENGRRVSHKQMENKRALFDRRNELSQEVLHIVRDHLSAYVKTPAYAERMADLIRQASDAFEGAPIVIGLRHEDELLGPILSGAVKEHVVTFTDSSFSLGGLTAECPGRNQRLNLTFDANWDDWRERFFAEINI